MKKLIMCCLVLLLMLTGCTKKVDTTVYYDGKDFSIDGKSLNMESYSGTEAKILSDDHMTAYNLYYRDGSDFTKDENNTKKRMKSEFKELFEDFYYCPEALGTMLQCYYKVDKKHYICCMVYTNDSVLVDTMAHNAYEYCTSLPMGNKGCKVVCSNLFTVEGATITPAGIYVGDYLFITYGEQDERCRSTTNLMDTKGNVIVMQSGSDTEYQYYYYNGYSFKVKLGYNLQELIVL